MKVGDKVVCVKTPVCDDGEAHPVKGDILTIREVIDYIDGVRFIFKEIVNRPRLYKCGAWQGVIECCFPDCFFRPVDYSFGEKVCEEIVKQTEELVCQH